MNRREFLDTSLKAGSILAAPAYIENLVVAPPSDRINVAVVGVSGDRPSERGMIDGRGMDHVRGYAQLPNVRVTAVCDVDERLFPHAVSTTEELYGATPKTEVEFRRLLEDDDIDVVSLATPDHWHALQTIWACQAGKDVYVEKPVSYNLSEGRKMVEAARKYNRVVLGGMTRRFSRVINEAVNFVHEGKLGEVYMAKTVAYNHRPSIGTTPEEPVPEGVHWDRFLGPAPYRPFSKNRFLYNWHWMWDTGTTDLGNIGIYDIDLARWALNKDHHPAEVHCTGGLFGRDDDQETPNTLAAVYEYEDGTIMQSEVRNLYTNLEGSSIRLTLLYSDEGWMEISGNGFETYFGPDDEPGPSLSSSDIPDEERINGWKEFIDCIRNRQPLALRNDIEEGHMSAALVHLALASYRTGRKLTFDPDAEIFPDDEDANSYLTRDYRSPYELPETI
jgi:predicted dehydrogenase